MLQEIYSIISLQDFKCLETEISQSLSQIILDWE